MSKEFIAVPKPNVPLTLCPIVDAYKLEPVVLAVADAKRYTETGVDYSEDFVVAVGKLTARHLSEFESKYKMTIKSMVNAIITYEGLMSKATKEDVEMLKTEYGIYKDSENNKFYVDNIVLNKEPESALLDVVAFGLSRFGRIDEVVGDDDYVVQSVTFDEVLDNLSAASLTVRTADGQTAVFELLSKLGVTTFEAVNEEASDVDPLLVSGEETPQEPKLKSSPAKKSVNAKTKNATKTAK